MPNTWRVLSTVPAINAHLKIELGLSELLSVYYCKFFENKNFELVLRNEAKQFVEEALRQPEKAWLKISDWQAYGKEDKSFESFSKGYKPVC